MKKENLFRSLLITLLLSILTSLVLAIVYACTRNWAIAYVIAYALMLVFFIKKFKMDLINNAKSFKDDLKKNWLNILIITLILTILLYISNYIIVKYMHSLATNEIMVRGQLYSSPILMGIDLIILAPLVEEMIYRFPYRHVNKHKLLNFLVYSLVFALAHISINNGFKELIYLIPYLFLSIGIGYSFYKTNNIYMSMIVHILNNFINVMVLLFL